MKQRILLFALSLLTACTVFGQQKKPNILFIMSDDHTSQAIGAYGSRLAKLNPTPNIDQLAKDGMRFDRVFCHNSICTPSRANIMTGQYSQRNGVQILGQSLPPERQYLAQEMKKAGYDTAMIGKWHLRAPPEAFDYYCVLPGQGKYFDPVFRIRGPKFWEDNTIQMVGKHSSDAITDLGIEWLSKGWNREKPFFLMHHYKAPHDMFENAPRYDSYLEEIPIPEPANLRNPPPSGMGSGFTKGHESWRLGERLGVDPSLEEPEYSRKVYQVFMKRYLRCVKGVDDNIGRLIEYLKEIGEFDNTIILYTGDQGYFLGEHDLMDKRWMYEEAFRMPFIVRAPGLVEPGSSNDWLINNTDFAPTMLELAGVETPEYMQGHSFAPALKGEARPEDWRTSLYYRYWMHMAHHLRVPAHFGLRTDRYKLIFFYGIDFKKKFPDTVPYWEFYDLQNDPAENVNQYGNPEYQEMIGELKKELKQIRIDLDETDAAYPEIQAVIDAHWNDLQPVKSSLVYPGSDGRLEYKPYTKQGDTILDFSYCGYKKSEEPIPDVPVVETVNPLPGKAEAERDMAYPRGPDSFGQIQAALDKVAAMQADTNGFRGAVLLTKGTYYVNGELTVDSGVVLRGEGDGEDGTVLIFRNPKGTGISVGRGVKTELLDAESEIRDRYVPSGSMSIALRKADDFKPGDMILITKITNEDWIEKLGMDRIEGEGNRPWKADSYQLKHVRMVTQVAGNRLSLDVPLPQSFDEDHCEGKVQAVDLGGSSEMCGVEGLRIISNYDTSVKSDTRAYDGPYLADEEKNLDCGVKLKCINGWVRNCTVMHTQGQAVQMSGSRYTTVRDCRSLQPVSIIRGSRRYSFSNGGGTLGLVYKCFAEFGRHDYVTGARQTGPIAFVNCSSDHCQAVSEPHHRWATGILYDNIVMKNGGFLQAVNRGGSGSGHGWAGGNVVFWNCAADVVLVSDPPTSEQNFAIGYTGEKLDEYPTVQLGYANKNVEHYEGKRGRRAEYEGFALMGNGFIEAPDRPVEPRSLFKQQLIDRIGEKKAMLVLR